MDRSVIAELHRLLSTVSGGGLIASRSRLDSARLAATAAEHGAHFDELHGPSNKASLLVSLREALRLRPYTGSNWDALEEVMAYPEPSETGPVLLAWHDPEQLPPGDMATFVEILNHAVATRARTGSGPLVIVAGPMAREPGSAPGTRTLTAG
jgi:barstar (barnase inhibitor)